MNISELIHQIDKIDSFKRYGKITRVVGLMIESQGPASSIGDVCYIYPKGQAEKDKIMAEVVGFREETVILMPYTAVSDISPGSVVEATGKPLEIKVGTGLIGMSLDALGQPLNERSLPKGMATVQTEQDPPNPMQSC